MYTCVCVYVYIFAASDDVDDFPVCENRGKQTARSLCLILLLYNLHIEEEFCKSNGKTDIFKENSLWDKTHNLTTKIIKIIIKINSESEGSCTDIVKSDTKKVQNSFG